MKKISVTLVIVMILSLFALPMRTEAKTIAQFEAEVEKFTAELQAKQNSLNKNKAEIEVIKQKISNIKVDETRISYDNNHYTLFNWKEHKLKPLTQRDEMKQFLITLGEYIKVILNTESAKELIQLKDIEDVIKYAIKNIK